MTFLVGEVSNLLQGIFGGKAGKSPLESIFANLLNIFHPNPSNPIVPQPHTPVGPQPSNPFVPQPSTPGVPQPTNFPIPIPVPPGPHAPSREFKKHGAGGHDTHHFNKYDHANWGPHTHYDKSHFSDYRRSDWGPHNHDEHHDDKGHFSDYGHSDWGRSCPSHDAHEQFDYSHSDWAGINRCPEKPIDIENLGSKGTVEFGDYKFTFDQKDSTWTMTNTKTCETTKVWGDPHLTNPDGKTVTGYGDFTFNLDNGMKVVLKTVDNADKAINTAGYETSHGVTPQASWSEKVTISDGHRSVTVDNLHSTDGKGLTISQSGGGVDTSNTTALRVADKEWIIA